MVLRLFLLFAIVPVVELYLLIQVGMRIGAISTLLLVLLTAMVGANLARLQGMQTLYRIRLSLSEGKMPGEELLNGLLILIAGILLLTPGFITDILGFLLLLPKTRTFFRNLLQARVARWLSQGNLRLRLFF